MGSIGGPEILVILVIALLVLGPERLPDAARTVGRVVGELRRMASGFQAELRDAMSEPAPPPVASAPLPEHSSLGGASVPPPADGPPVEPLASGGPAPAESQESGAPATDEATSAPS